MGEVFWENKYPASKCGGNYNVPACTQDPAKFRELQLAELKNGRLAMIGIISFRRRRPSLAACPSTPSRSGACTGYYDETQRMSPLRRVCGVTCCRCVYVCAAAGARVGEHFNTTK